MNSTDLTVEGASVDVSTPDTSRSPDFVATPFPGFPAHRVEVARKALEDAHRRAVRAAARAGQEAPGVPVLTVLRMYVQSRCRTCGHLWEGVGDCPARASCRRVLGQGYSRRELADLALSAPRLHLAGWEFLAVIEPVVDGNLVRRHPSATVTEGELAIYREGAMICDHCQTLRGRRETFVVRADGTAGVAAGTLCQVGRNCLKAFLGGRSPEGVVLALSWIDVVARSGGDGEGGGGGWDRTIDPEEFLTWVSAATRVSGFVTKAAVRARSDDGPPATASLVAYLTGPAPYTDQGRQRWLDARATYAPVDEDAVRGAATLAWARSLAGTSDYEHNLRLVARQSMLDAAKNGGILASAVPAKDRVEGRVLARRAETAPRAASRHEGEVGGRIEAVVTVERCVSLESDYGPSHLLAMRDDRGSALSWVTGTRTFEVGIRLRIQGTVKQHKDYQGEAVTQLTRCTAERVGPEIMRETCAVVKTKAKTGTRRSRKTAVAALAPDSDGGVDVDAR